MKIPNLSTSATDFIRHIHLGDDVVAFHTTRGKSHADDPYSDFNICHYTGDNDSHIVECRSRLCDALGITENRLIVPRQTHSINIATITSLPQKALDDTDAIVTTMKDIVIGINTADCVPILFVDPSAGVIAVAHAGWKGAVRRIASATVNEMVRLGTSTKRIDAAMGPCICADCFEVGDEVAEQFRANGFDIDRHTFRNPATGKAHIDLPGLCRDDIVSAGVTPTKIAMPKACTRCHPDQFFSARRLGIKSGRIFTAIALSSVKKL